jgi:hypothetical protein
MLWAVVIVLIPKLRVTLVGLSKNHAMTFNRSAATRRYP